MQQEVTFNQEKKGIEVRYSQKPLAQVRTELYNMGFRYHWGKKFWYAPVTEARIVFAKQLQQTPDVTPESETFEASFDPTPENISAGNFSYVTFAVKGEGKKTIPEDYIVFEQGESESKSSSTGKTIRGRALRSQTEEITVHPRNYKRKACELFSMGQIIGGTVTASRSRYFHHGRWKP